MKNLAVFIVMIINTTIIFADDAIIPTIPSSNEINQLVGAPKAGCDQCGMPADSQAPIGTLLNSMPLSSISLGTIFQITKDIELKNPSNKKMEDTIILLNGKIIGTSQYPNFLTAVNTRDELKSKLGTILGKDTPDSGMYCFIQAKSAGSLSLSKGKYQVLDCMVQEPVSKVENGTTTNFSFNLFGKTNQSIISSCSMGTIGDNPGQPASLGCISYRSEKVPTTEDFIKAIGSDSSIIRFADPRSPEKIKADQAAERAKMEKLAQQKLAREEKEKAAAKKEEAEFDDFDKRRKASEIWFQEYLKKMPKYNDPALLKLTSEQPEAKKLYQECQGETFRSLKHMTMPQPCVDFFALIKK